jgi:hypothetical protein
MIAKGILAFSMLAATAAHGDTLQSRIVDFDQKDESDVVVLKNDAFVDNGGQAYLQLGFVEGEKVGIYVYVPENIDYFKIDYFRVLIGSSSLENGEPKETQPISVFNTQVFFEMGIADEATLGIPRSIENAAQVTPGPYWNDIPAQGVDGALGCARGGQVVGAALEFTHSGAPSVYRDLDGLSDVKYNLLMGIPGGWNYSAIYGLRGDWILRVVGHEASADEC